MLNLKCIPSLLKATGVGEGGQHGCETKKKKRKWDWKPTFEMYTLEIKVKKILKTSLTPFAH